MTSTDTGWKDIKSAPRDGTIFDVWLGNAAEEDCDFYCVSGSRRSTNWHWKDGKFRPYTGLYAMATFVIPTHWMSLPPPPIQGDDHG